MGKDSTKKKRDPNKPTPKPKKKSFVKKLLVSVVVVVLSLWVGLYSLEVKKGPWDWKSAHWKGFLTFSKKQVEEAAKQVEDVDWEALKDKVTAKTKELWDKAPELEERLEKKLAELRGESKGDATKKVDGEDAKPGMEAAVATPSELELGCETLRLAIRTYKKSMNSQSKLKKAKKLFQDAQDHLTKAYDAAQAKGDTASASEIEGYLQQCQQYLEDCSKRQTL